MNIDSSQINLLHKDYSKNKLMIGYLCRAILHLFIYYITFPTHFSKFKKLPEGN